MRGPKSLRSGYTSASGGPSVGDIREAMEGLPHGHEAVEVEIGRFAALHGRLEVLIAQSEVEREIGFDFPVVLKIVGSATQLFRRVANGADTDLASGGEPEQKIGELVVASGRCPRRLSRFHRSRMCRADSRTHRKSSSAGRPARRLSSCGNPSAIEMLSVHLPELIQAIARTDAADRGQGVAGGECRAAP